MNEPVGPSPNEPSRLALPARKAPPLSAAALYLARTAFGAFARLVTMSAVNAGLGSAFPTGPWRHAPDASCCPTIQSAAFDQVSVKRFARSLSCLVACAFPRTSRTPATAASVFIVVRSRNSVESPHRISGPNRPVPEPSQRSAPPPDRPRAPEGQTERRQACAAKLDRRDRR